MKTKTALVLALLTALYLSACTLDKPRSEEAAPVQVKITQVNSSLLNMPLYAGLEEGFFEKEGLAVELEEVLSQEEALEKLFSGETDLIVTGPEIFFYGSQQQKTPQVLPLAKLSTTSGYFLIARQNNNPSFSWQNLKGKVVLGCKDGEIPGILLEYILSSNSLRPFTDVSLVGNLPFSLLPGTFKAGSGHFLLASEPTASVLESDGTGVIVSSLELAIKPLAANVISITPRYLEEQQANCQKIINGLEESLKWLAEKSPEEITAAGIKRLAGCDKKTLLKSISRYKTLGVWPFSAALFKEELENLQDILEKRKEITGKIKCDLFLTDYFQYSNLPPSGQETENPSA